MSARACVWRVRACCAADVLLVSSVSSCSSFLSGPRHPPSRCFGPPSWAFADATCGASNGNGGHLHTTRDAARPRPGGRHPSRRPRERRVSLHGLGERIPRQHKGGTWNPEEHAGAGGGTAGSVQQRAVSSLPSSTHSPPLILWRSTNPASARWAAASKEKKKKHNKTRDRPRRASEWTYRKLAMTVIFPRAMSLASDKVSLQPRHRHRGKGKGRGGEGRGRPRTENGSGGRRRGTSASAPGIRTSLAPTSSKPRSQTGATSQTAIALPPAPSQTGSTVRQVRTHPPPNPLAPTRAHCAPSPSAVALPALTSASLTRHPNPIPPSAPRPPPTRDEQKRQRTRSRTYSVSLVTASGLRPRSTAASTSRGTVSVTAAPATSIWRRSLTNSFLSRSDQEG